MGWLSMTSAGMGGHATPKAYLDAQFTYSRTDDGGGTRGMRVIDSAFVGNRVWYAATEILADGEVQYVNRAGVPCPLESQGQGRIFIRVQGHGGIDGTLPGRMPRPDPAPLVADR